jgi:hypothetical protein
MLVHLPREAHVGIDGDEIVGPRELLPHGVQVDVASAAQHINGLLARVEDEGPGFAG